MEALGKQTLQSLRSCNQRIQDDAKVQNETHGDSEDSGSRENNTNSTSLPSTSPVFLDEPPPLIVMKSFSKLNTTEREDYLLNGLSLMKINSFSSADRRSLSLIGDQNLSHDESPEVEERNDGNEKVVNLNLNLSSQQSPSERQCDGEVRSYLLGMMKEVNSQDSKVKMLDVNRRHGVCVNNASHYEVPLLTTDNKDLDLIEMNSSDADRSLTAIIPQRATCNNSASCNSSGQEVKNIQNHKESIDSEENRAENIAGASSAPIILFSSRENCIGNVSKKKDIITRSSSLPILQEVRQTHLCSEISPEKEIPVSIVPRRTAEKNSIHESSQKHSREVLDGEIDEEIQSDKVTVQINKCENEKCTNNEEKCTVDATTQTDTQENDALVDFVKQSDDGHITLNEDISKTGDSQEFDMKDEDLPATQDSLLSMETDQICELENSILSQNTKDNSTSLENSDCSLSVTENPEKENSPLTSDTSTETEESSTLPAESQNNSSNSDEAETESKDKTLQIVSDDTDNLENIAQVSLSLNRSGSQMTAVFKIKGNPLLSKTLHELQTKSEKEADIQNNAPSENLESESQEGAEEVDGPTDPLSVSKTTETNTSLDHKDEETEPITTDEIVESQTPMEIDEASETMTTEDAVVSEPMNLPNQKEVDREIQISSTLSVGDSIKDVDIETPRNANEVSIETPINANDISIETPISAKGVEIETRTNHTSEEIVQRKGSCENDNYIVRSWSNSSANTVVLCDNTISSTQNQSSDENDDAEMHKKWRPSFQQSNDQNSLSNISTSASEKDEVDSSKSDMVIKMKESLICQTNEPSNWYLKPISTESSNDKDITTHGNEINASNGLNSYDSILEAVTEKKEHQSTISILGINQHIKTSDSTKISKTDRVLRSASRSQIDIQSLDKDQGIYDEQHTVKKENEETNEEPLSVRKSNFEGFQKNVSKVEQCIDLAEHECTYIKEHSIDKKLLIKAEKNKIFLDKSGRSSATSNETQTMKKNVEVAIEQCTHLLSVSKQENVQLNISEILNLISNKLYKKLAMKDIDNANPNPVNIYVKDTGNRIKNKRKAESTIQRDSIKISKTDRVLRSARKAKRVTQSCDKDQGICEDLQAAKKEKPRKRGVAHTPDNQSVTSRTLKRKGTSLPDEPSPQKVPRKETEENRRILHLTQASSTKQKRKPLDHSPSNIEQDNAQVITAGTLNVIKDLLQSTGPESRGIKDSMPLHMNITDDQCEQIGNLLKSISRNIADENGQTSEQVATSKQNAHTPNFLPNQNTNTERRDHSVKTYRDMITSYLFGSILEAEKKRIQTLLELAGNLDSHLEDRVREIITKEPRLT